MENFSGGSLGTLAGRVALVTGGASGLGRAAAIALANGGASVYVLDIDAQAGQQVAEQVGGTFLCLDVADESAWQGVREKIAEKHGHLEIAVLAAGTGGVVSTVAEMPLEAWHRVMAVNVDGTLLGMKTAMGLMGKGGSIITVSSTGGVRAAPFLSAYTTSKGAVRLLSKAAAVECARRGTGIRVNCIIPGSIETPLLDKLIHGTPLDPEVMRKMLLQLAPMGRFGQPEEFASLVCFLASEQSSYMTGAELVLDGGMLAG